jgi:hypothetical protein
MCFVGLERCFIMSKYCARLLQKESHFFASVQRSKVKSEIRTEKKKRNIYIKKNDRPARDARSCARQGQAKPAWQHACTLTCVSFSARRTAVPGTHMPDAFAPRPFALFFFSLTRGTHGHHQPPARSLPRVRVLNF